jgi:sugar phosphate isomerase/epimerase
MRSAIQLYTLRGLDATLPELLDLVGSTGIDGVEFAGLGESSPEEVSKALDTADLSVAGAHVGAEVIDSDLEGTVETYRTVGADTLVVPYLDESHFSEAQTVDRTASTLEEWAEAIADGGGRLCYHNHEHEFASVGDRTAWELLVERTDPVVGFELDVGWARAGGSDPADLLDEYGDRIPLVHLKDVDAETNRPVDLGDGDVDLDRCLAAACRADVDYIVFEHDDPDDPEASLRRGTRWMLNRA